MVSPTAKNIIAGTGLFGCVVMTFNGFVWQMQRRRWKDQLIDSFDNMQKPPLTQLPKPGEPVKEFMPVDVKGTFDNEGSVVVGPRPMPNKKDGRGNDEDRAGFLILTPFEEENTGVMIMVNRGWVPIDAAKSRIQRVQYTGDGFRHVQLKGFIRKEEKIDSWWYGEETDANSKPQIGTAWLCCRPYEILRDYYGRRWGANQIEARTEKHGARRWMVEMVEDHSGEDQRIIKGQVFPMRRTQNDLTHVSITPLVHGFYAAFWFTTCVMSVYMMRKIIVDQRAGVLARKARDQVLARDTSRLTAESDAFYQQVKRAAATGSSAATLDLSAKAPDQAIGGNKDGKAQADQQPPKQ